MDDNDIKDPAQRVLAANLEKLIRMGGVTIEALAETPAAFNIRPRIIPLALRREAIARRRARRIAKGEINEQD